ncbi:hypothetical protein CF319_g5617 [Tilletia indica]|uniref:Uncharacterized protein n=1 Tax=Tilletia indica TaxID=43049 RepID=A0A177TM97_9BASI|nr:hypothetical protein CF319_g5617 [Tilletia indica]KAE8248835.1 hypothetical protein A4X13_0g5454 [Tilletia indica]
MPDPALQAYLASKYLSGPKADAILARVDGDDQLKKKKKKKRKHDDLLASTSSGSGLKLRDEDELRGGAGGNHDDDEDAMEAQVVEGPKQSKFSRSAFIRVKKEGEEDDDDDGGDEMALDERPQIASTTADIKPVMPPPPVDENDLQFQTVYRDASGRKIDLKAEEEARKAAEVAKRRKDEERKTWGMGIKQKEDQQVARQRLREEATTSFARHADDKKMNDTLRAVERSDDPALAFLTKKRTSTTSGPAKPRYKGPTPPPNRFGIQPGYRWDGVDRSTGFERMYFQKLNERKRRDASSRAYDQDDL